MRLVLTSFFFLFVVGLVSAQDRPVDAVPWEEYGNIRWRDEKAVLDRYANILRRSPDSLVYIFAYSGVRPCKGTAKTRALRARNYLVTRPGIAPDRVIWKDGGFRTEISTELWLLQRSDTPPTPYSIIDQASVPFIRGCAPARGRRAKVRARPTSRWTRAAGACFAG